MAERYVTTLRKIQPTIEFGGFIRILNDDCHNQRQSSGPFHKLGNIFGALPRSWVGRGTLLSTNEAVGHRALLCPEILVREKLHWEKARTAPGWYSSCSWPQVHPWPIRGTKWSQRLNPRELTSSALSIVWDLSLLHNLAQINHTNRSHWSQRRRAQSEDGFMKWHFETIPLPANYHCLCVRGLGLWGSRTRH